MTIQEAADFLDTEPDVVQRFVGAPLTPYERFNQTRLYREELVSFRRVLHSECDDARPVHRSFED
jgi:hypothetical protein